MSAPVFALDTSCIIAAVCGWHERHAHAAFAIERHLEAGHTMSVAAHALSEAYAVLTRLPAPHRLAPADAWAVLRGSFVDGGLVTTIPARRHVALLARLAAGGLAGGRTYDAIIGECARHARASVLLTFNPRHFEPAPEGVAIVVPE